MTEERLDQEGNPRTPPDARRVALRLLAVLAVHFRVNAERPSWWLPRWQLVAWPLLRKRSLRKWNRYRTEKLLPWLRETGVWDEMEAHERALVARPFGTLDVDSQEAANGYWLGSGADVLAWALGRPEFSPFYDQEPPLDVASWAGLLDPLPIPLLANPVLRPLSDIEAMEDRLLAVHWRLVQFRLTREALDFLNLPIVKDFRFLKPEVVERLDLAEGDLAIRGTSIAKAHPGLVEACRSVAMERHRAVNWLLGEHPVYSEVETNT